MQNLDTKRLDAIMFGNLPYIDSYHIWPFYRTFWRANHKGVISILNSALPCTGTWHERSPVSVAGLRIRLQWKLEPEFLEWTLIASTLYWWNSVWVISVFHALLAGAFSIIVQTSNVQLQTFKCCTEIMRYGHEACILGICQMFSARCPPKTRRHFSSCILLQVTRGARIDL